MFASTFATSYYGVTLRASESGVGTRPAVGVKLDCVHKGAASTMTLVLGVLSHGYVIQVSDRRVTAASNGALIEDRRNKVVVMCSSFAFSYSGLAEIGFQNTDTWLARQLDGHDTVPNAIEHVRGSATKELLGVDAVHRRHTFVGIGWAKDEIGFLPVGFTVSNALDATGDWLATARDAFEVKSQILERDEALKLCKPVGARVPQNRLAELQKNLRCCVQRSVHPLEIVRLLGETIRRVADVNERVGRNLSAVILPKVAAGRSPVRLETPKKSSSTRSAVENPMFYTAKEDAAFEGTMPILVCGGKILAGSIELGLSDTTCDSGQERRVSLAFHIPIFKPRCRGQFSYDIL